MPRASSCWTEDSKYYSTPFLGEVGLLCQVTLGQGRLPEDFAELAPILSMISGKSLSLLQLFFLCGMG